MGIKTDDISIYTKELPKDFPRDPGYDEWVRVQLEEAVKDLDNGGEADLSHEEVFAELDKILQDKR